MSRTSARGTGLAMVVALSWGAASGAAQAARYPRMAAVDQYLMDRAAEVQLARSAAPEAISRDATILVLGRGGYETVVEGSNGFVCMVGRSWLAAFDWPEFWNPKVRAADCMNPQTARFMMPTMLLRSRMVMAGRSSPEVLAALAAAYRKGELPRLESGAMDYMMAKGSYLTDEGDHNMPHLMFASGGVGAGDWGAGATGSPIMAAPYWFFSPEAAPAGNELPAILVFLVGVQVWSDGTPAASRGD